MSRQADKALAALKAGEERIKRNEAFKLLESLGFKTRTKGSHRIFSHPKTQNQVNWPHRKASAPVFGYEMVELKKAVFEVLELFPTPEPVLKPTLVNDGKEIETMKQAVKPAPALAAPAATCITTKHYPNAVAEMVFAYEQKEITGSELANDLNSSGYRTANGAPFDRKTLYSKLVNNSAYRIWKERHMHTLREASKIESVKTPILVEAVPPVVEKPVVETPMQQHDAIKAIAAVLEENERLREENRQLKSRLNQVANIVCLG